MRGREGANDHRGQPMSISRSGYRRNVADHFEPGEEVDANAQRQLRRVLEQIDILAYSANRQVLGALGEANPERLQRLATAAAAARARWVATALAVAEAGPVPSREQIQNLAAQRAAYDELSEAYAALRRMVERGYLTFPSREPPES